MSAKAKKRTLLIVVPVFLLVVVPLFIYWLEYGSKPLINQLPDEEIISVAKHPFGSDEKSLEIELSQEKIGSFFDLIKNLKYKKRFNLLKCRCTLGDDIEYIINYDNYTVRLREHGIWVHNNEGLKDDFEISEMRPSGTFAEIDKLFLEK